MTDEKAPVQDSLDELSAQAQTPEDKAVIEQWQKEVDAERASTLSGSEPTELKQMPDGSIVTKAEADEVKDSGEAGPYDKGRRA